MNDLLQREALQKDTCTETCGSSKESSVIDSEPGSQKSFYYTLPQISDEQF